MCRHERTLGMEKVLSQMEHTVDTGLLRPEETEERVSRAGERCLGAKMIP